jgi:hypothetical protein
MWRHFYCTLAGGGAIALFVLLVSCGTSGNKQRQIASAVNTFSSEWKDGNLRGIYDSADPQFRKVSFEDWSSWKNTIDQRCGGLKAVNIRTVDRIAPLVDVYDVKADLEYEKGTTKGSFTFIFRNGSPHLIGAVLVRGG